MKDEKSNKINYIFNTGYQILTVLTPLITAPYVSRVLGANAIGQYSYTYSIVTYFVLLATLGTTTFGQREISYNKGSIEERSIVFWRVFLFRCFSTIAMLAFYFCCIPLFGGKANVTLLLIQSIYIINVACDITWFFQGMAEFVTITIRNTIVRISSLVLIFLLVKSPDDIGVYCFILAFSTTVGLVVTFPLLKNRVCRTHLNKVDIFAVCKDCFPLFIPTVAVQVYTVLDKTMIGFFTISSVENGYYDQAEKIVKMTVVLVTSLSTVLAPKIASAHKSNNNDEVLGYVRTLIKYVIFIGFPISIGLFSISDYFIPFFLGEGYEKCSLLMKLFSPIVVLLGMSNVFGTTFLVQTSRQKAVNCSVIMGACVNLCFNLLLIPKLYSIGAAIGSVIAEATVASVQLFVVKKYFRVRELFQGIQVYLISGFVMGGITILLGRIMVSIGILNWIIVASQIFVGILSYFSILYLKRDPMIVMIINTISRRRKQ